MLRDALTRGSCANIFYLPMVTKIDIFALGPSPYDEVEFSRRRKVKVRASGEELFVKAPEDTILRKLLWYREGGEVSSKQWRDIVEVLRVSGAEINDQYLSMWAEKLRVNDLLTRAQAEAAAKLGSQ
ncbi:hypothetical protein WME75_39680 [Sorangium sp. So ce1014]|uniref:hypothetical protein n=1 Tax=Sorangium sp. So ce1014 TaxID=3133326 RepID=UPI003F61FEF5